MPRTRRSTLLAVLGLAAAVAAHGPVAAGGRKNASPATGLTLSAPAPPAAWLVELEEPGAAVAWAEVVEESAPAGPTLGVIARARAAAESRLLSIGAAQEALAPALGRLGAREIYRVRRALNGIAVLATRQQAIAFRHLAGVRAVRPIAPEFPQNRTSVPFIGAPEMWGSTTPIAGGVTGRGVRIGIIDTGVDYMHGDFGGTGLLADYEQAAADSAGWTTNPDSGPGRFPTAKVAGGWDFAGDAYTAGALPAPDPNPMDCHGHGSHVAGTAAGFGVTAAGATYTGPYNSTDPFSTPPRIGPGVAPEATLYALRVFGCGGSTALTAQAIDWAIDPNGDGDFSDRLDVVNMSLGTDFGYPNDVTAEASDNAARAGVVVVASAGNSADTYFVAGSPAVAARAISVASSIDDGKGALLRANAPASLAGDFAAGKAFFGPNLADGPVVGDVALVDDGTGTATDGCEPLVGFPAGAVALVDRGTCSFKAQTLNAQNAGAIGVVSSWNVPYPPPLGDDPTITTPITIPTVSATLATADAIKAALASGTVNVTLLAAGDSLWALTSRGPSNAFPVRLKPDVAAPGYAITSVQAGRTSGGYVPDNASTMMSGTSMAAPHVAGVMALLKQLHPDWTVEELKALVMNHSLHDVSQYSGGLGLTFGAGRVGAGRVDAVLAAQGLLIALDAEEPGVVSVGFGGEVEGTVTRRHRVRVESFDAQPHHLLLGVQASVAAPGVTFSLGTSTLDVPAEGFANFDVVMTADATQMKLDPDPTVATTQGGLARHRLAEAASFVTFTVSDADGAAADGAAPAMRLPVYAAVKPVSSTSATGPLQTGGAAAGTGSITLQGSGVCTGTLASSTCTGTFPADRASLASAFELQGVSPKSPDLYGTGFEAGDLEYAGVQYDSGHGLLVFGLATWDTWATPAQVAFDVIVDGNGDGTDDRVLFNPRFAAAGLPADLHLGGTASYPSGSGVASNYYVNLVSPADVDTGLFGSSVLMLGATPAQLGITVGEPFRWRVVSCPGFDPLCGLPGGSPLDSMGPFTWSTAGQGLDFDGGWALDDQDGAAIPVSWSTANLAANGSVGALLLHHLGAEGRRAEAVLVQTSATTPPPTADLAVTIGVSNPLPQLHSEVAVTATVSNAGPEDASGVAVHVPIPAGLAYVSHSGLGAYVPATGIWTVGTLPAGGAAAGLQVAVTAAVSGVYSLLAEVSTSMPLDIAEANNRAAATLTVPPEGFVAPGGYYTLRPCRLVDTRTKPDGTWAGPALGAQRERIFPLWGRCNVPATARSVALNVTVTGPTRPGALDVYAPATGPIAATSVLHFAAGETRANNAVVSLDDAGQLAVFNGMRSGTVHLVMDVAGYFE
jgi:uncharacterized repeat protein (TIGR01451 family)